MDERVIEEIREDNARRHLRLIDARHRGVGTSGETEEYGPMSRAIESVDQSNRPATDTRHE